MRDFLMYMGFAFFPVTIVLVPLWLAALSRARRAEATVKQIALGTPQLAPGQMNLTPDINLTLDAILIEVERIAEGQRFTTKLLAERHGAGTSQASEKIVTPR